MTNLRAGKLPSELLATLLSGIHIDDPRVIVGPGVGRDAAVIDIGHGRSLVLTSDPITFAVEDLGWYAVHVNANDIACMGAEPLWMLATLLLPLGADAGLASSITEQMAGAARDIGVSIVGGHTEMTMGIDRPIVSIAMIGEAANDEVITGEGVAEGDAVLLTQGIAIEGTALLAREATIALRAAGVDEETIAEGGELLRAPGLSVLEDALLLRAVSKPRLLHDPTEGGLAMALHELAHAAGAALRIDRAAIRVLPQTRTFCEALGLDPMGLLASGTLLAILDRAYVTETQQALESAGRACRVIGTVGRGETGVIMADDGRETPLPRFERDELARFLDAEPQHGRPEGTDV